MSEQDVLMSKLSDTPPIPEGFTLTNTGRNQYDVGLEDWARVRIPRAE